MFPVPITPWIAILYQSKPISEVASGESWKPRL